MFQPLPPVAREAQILLEPDAAPQYPSARLNASNCVLNADGWEIPYSYEIQIGFNDSSSREAFLRSPDIGSNATTIRRAVEQEMRPVFELESDRDTSPYYEYLNTDPQTTIRTITPGTQGDIEVVAQDNITPLIQQTFPDAGIVNIGIANVRGVDKDSIYENNGIVIDAGCSPNLSGSPHAMNETAPAQQQMAMAGGIRGGMGGPGF